MRIIAAVLTAVLLGCGSARELKPPNIIWINAEDTSPMWGAYGDAQATTPRIDALAERGILYRNAFANAPICAPARSTLITGMYAPSLGTEHLRSEIPRTLGIGAVPEYLRQAGYFTTNNGKTDYNFSPDGVWDLNIRNDNAPWRHRSDDRPFFSILNHGQTHEGPSNRPDRYDAATADLPAELFHDPDHIQVPPYYPDTPEFRKQWARVYDLITVYDRLVGETLDALEEDGLLDDTIVFVFTDHGAGMPRYKRWLTDSGMRVPLVVWVPEKYRDLTPVGPGDEVEDLVSFVDFGPTALRLAGVDIPEHMHGRPFLGRDLPEPRDYVFGYRGRADDMYETSRALHEGDWIYVRHYTPYLPYIQPGRIFDDSKTSFRELRRLHEAGELPAESEEMWQPKPVEELYDLTADPAELTNLADVPEHAERKQRMHDRLTDLLVEIRDVGLLLEPEMMIRSEGSSPYEIARDPAKYDVEATVAAAELVGSGDVAAMREKLSDDDSAVRFWAIQALIQAGKAGAAARADLEKALDDPSPIVGVAAAHALCRLGDCAKGLPTLEQWLDDERLTTKLYAGRTLQLIGDAACPAAPKMRTTVESLRDPSQNSGYQDFNYSAFTGWALEVALENCGAALPPAR